MCQGNSDFDSVRERTDGQHGVADPCCFWALFSDAPPVHGWRANRRVIPALSMSFPPLNVIPAKALVEKGRLSLSSPFDSAQGDLKDSSLQGVMLSGVEACPESSRFINKPESGNPGLLLAVTRALSTGMHALRGWRTPSSANARVANTRVGNNEAGAR
jgi:hypothetical protein